MNWLDYILVAIIGISALMTARRGFSREVIGLAGMVLALVLGMWFYRMAGTMIVAPFTKSESLVNFLGFLIVVAAVMICSGITGAIVNRLLKTIGLSFFDRLMGLIFGAVKGLLIAVALVTAFTAFGPWVDSKAVSGAMVHSQIAPWVLDASRLITSIAPMDLKESFGKQYSRLKATVQDSGARDSGARDRISGTDGK